MNRIKQFAGQTIIYGVGSILSRIVYYFLVTSFLSHILNDNTAEFGIFSKFYAFISVLIVIFSFRLDTALFRYGSNTKEFNKVFSASLLPVLVIAIVILIGSVIFSDSIAELINFSNTPEYVMYAGIILAFDTINLIPFAKLRLLNKAKSFALYKIFNVLISSFLIIFFLFLLPKIQGGIFGLHADDFGIISWVFIANIIASGLLFVALLPHIKSLSFKIDSALLSKMLKYSYPLVIIGIANGIIQFFGTPLQEWFLSGTSEENLAQAGIYDTTRRIASLFVMFTTAFNYAAEPFFFNNSTSSDREELYGKICRLFTLIGGLIIVTMVLSVDLIQYIVGSNFRASLNLLPILLMAYLFLGIYYNVSIWYKLSDKTKYGAIISILGMSITLIMSIILLPIIGYSASALATLFSYAIMVFIGYIWGQKHYPIDYPMKKIVIDLFVIIAVISIASYIHAFNLITLKYICFPVLFIVYVSYAFLMEKKEWLSLVRKSN